MLISVAWKSVARCLKEKVTYLLEKPGSPEEELRLCLKECVELAIKALIAGCSDFLRRSSDFYRESEDFLRKSCDVLGKS